MSKKINHNNNELEIRRVEINDVYCITVYKGNKPVSPTYSVSKEIESDYRVQTGGSMIDELEEVACRDIERGFYIS